MKLKNDITYHFLLIYSTINYCFPITELCVKFIKNICNHSPVPMLVTDLELMVSFLERTNCLPSLFQLHA